MPAADVSGSVKPGAGVPPGGLFSGPMPYAGVSSAGVPPGATSPTDVPPSGLPAAGVPISDIVLVRVGVIMGSQSDWATMTHTSETLMALGVPHENRIVSAHRTPDRLRDYAVTARDRGLRVIIAGAGGAAHLPGMAAAWTTLPVLGVPIESHALKGMDSLLSIVQMPAGIPVGALAIGRAGAINAALLAAAILATTDAALVERLDAWRTRQTGAVANEPDGGTGEGAGTGGA
jgi:5-(carboxyamino)imidazole ribonucleotide mutase